MASPATDPSLPSPRRGQRSPWWSSLAGARAPAVEKKTRKEEDRRDETNLSPQWRFHVIINVLETTLIRFIPM
jgi:hypothetical protein